MAARTAIVKRWLVVLVAVFILLQGVGDLVLGYGSSIQLGPEAPQVFKPLISALGIVSVIVAILLLRGKSIARPLATVLLSIQVPIFVSPYISYIIATGPLVLVGFESDFDIETEFGFWLAYLEIDFNSGRNFRGIALNMVPLIALSLYLFGSRRPPLPPENRPLDLE